MCDHENMALSSRFIQGVFFCSELDRAFVSAAIDDVNKSDFKIVVLKKYPVHIMYDAVERCLIAMIFFSEAGLRGDEFAEVVQFDDERISARDAESRFNVSGDLVRVCHEAGGVNNSAHRA
ncbi:hypothetical protein [uncultured Rhodoblastus sp.]|uniref:hypothetical protein n=1 Tax=uncultured Rhodoblastus sp. TaxID=543037 RepID=UPI0025E64E9E|nr:hypothetical protein [uncultured Rhodoblastus sp.]